MTALLLLLPLLALAARADDDGGGDSKATAVLSEEVGAGVWRAHPAPAAAGCSGPGVHSCALASEVADAHLHPLQAPLVVGHERRRRC